MSFHPSSHIMMRSTSWATSALRYSRGEKKLCQGIQEVIDQCNHWAIIRDEYPFEIDGMVIKVDEFRSTEYLWLHQPSPQMGNRL